MSESSVIHDIGYQRYTGPRLGRSAVFGAIYVHGVRAAYGFGRSAKSKIFPWLVFGIVTLVAVIIAAVRAQTGTVPLNYIQFADAMSWLIIFFVAIVAPELVSRDLRAGVLPLYFSRPVRAADYVGAKVAAMVTAVWVLLAGPQLIMFLGAALTTKKGMSGVWGELDDLLWGWSYSLLWALLFTGIGLLIASLTGKRAFAAGGIVAVFLMTTPVVGVLATLPSRTAQELAFLASPMTLVSGVAQWMVPNANTGLPIGRFGPVYAIEAAVLIVTCLLLLLARYRKVASL
ncbi:ABC transporter permease [Amorphoplanes digitatis]|uniref:ABC-2 type transport system permease protein n=1 Tax=Actinoplanes digitatis TaxID=1868 RepID=A0A7W7MTK0_9ACTN|nr:ABC transporter permease [Actinoplanes digitatis]MBB4766418.1 ABC-2 type transport system permease protein [Actinoplanes digitatis]BFE76498.1 ABC transporter permease [Actinoplanes digitatis]GID96752.1 membrane protein [Actinoplanes digitatis]